MMDGNSKNSEAGANMTRNVIPMPGLSGDEMTLKIEDRVTAENEQYGDSGSDGGDGIDESRFENPTEDTEDDLQEEEEGGDSAQAVPPPAGERGDRLFQHLVQRLGDLIPFLHPFRGTCQQWLERFALSPHECGLIEAKEKDQTERAERQPAQGGRPQVGVFALDVAMQTWLKLCRWNFNGNFIERLPPRCAGICLSMRIRYHEQDP